MNIAIVGDPHISNRFRARTDDYLHTVLNKIKSIADENDAVIFLGDVFDASSMPTYVFNETYKAFEPYKGKLHTILGNHDMFHRNLRALGKTTIGSLNLTNVLKIHTKPFELGGVTFVPVMTDDEFESIPVDDDNDSVLLCHKYYNMALCPEESLSQDELEDLNYRYVFMGHDHQPYKTEYINKNHDGRPRTDVMRLGSLTRITTDLYNKDRQIQYACLDTDTMNVDYVHVLSEPSEKVFLPGSFDKKEEVNSNIKTDVKSISKLLAKFDRHQVSHLSLEQMLRKLQGSEEQITYLRDLHRLHNMQYN